MTGRTLKILSLLFGISVVVHLLSYNLWRFTDNENKQMYVYCILNSLTHLGYSVMICYIANVAFLKLKTTASYMLKLFAFDWCLFGAADVYNQVSENYDSTLTWQWIAFIGVIIVDLYLINKWTTKHQNNTTL